MPRLISDDDIVRAFNQPAEVLRSPQWALIVGREIEDAVLKALKATGPGHE